MTKNKYLTLQVNLIEELKRLTIDNIHFNSDNWCEYDANVLEGAATLIREEINKKRKVIDIEATKRSIMVIK